MKNNNYFKIIVVFIIAAVLINTPLVKDNPVSKSLRSAGIIALYPIQFVSYKIFTGSGNIILSIINLRNAQKENEKLKIELKEEKAINSVFESILKDNKALRQSLYFKEHNPYHFSLIPAEVISRSPASWLNSAIINKGALHGVKSGKAVISEKGLIGRIVEVYPSMSKILLITDSNSSVSGVLKRTNHIGIVSGIQGTTLIMKFIPHSADVKEKDLVVTSGISDFFPKGIPIGTILKIEKKDFDLFQNIEIESLEDSSKVNKLFVIR